MTMSLLLDIATGSILQEVENLHSLISCMEKIFEEEERTKPKYNANKSMINANLVQPGPLLLFNFEKELKRG